MFISVFLQIVLICRTILWSHHAKTDQNTQKTNNLMSIFGLIKENTELFHKYETVSYSFSCITIWNSLYFLDDFWKNYQNLWTWRALDLANGLLTIVRCLAKSYWKMCAFQSLFQQKANKHHVIYLVCNRLGFFCLSFVDKAKIITKEYWRVSLLPFPHAHKTKLTNCAQKVE